MASYYKELERAPIKYIDHNGEIMKKIILPIRKKVTIHNSFKKKYFRGVVGTFNFAISRFMFFGIYDKDGNKRKFPMAQEYIYLPGHHISDAVGLKETQPYNIIRTLERIFDIHVVRANEKAGANKFRLSERVIEFLNIYTLSKLNEFIIKYQIDKKDQYALRQLYKYRVVRLSDDNMTSEEKQDYSKFVKSKSHRDFIHDISRNNESDQSRVEMIELNIELLSDRQIEQLQRIKQEIKNGVKRLVKRFHMKLVELQQFITISLKRNKHKEEEPSSEDSPSLTNSESNMKETAEHASATRVAQRKPSDEPSPGDIMQIAAAWNNVVRGVEHIPHIKKMDQKTYNAICSQVKSYGKETIISNIKKVTKLERVKDRKYKYNFGKFMTKKTQEIILSANITEDIDTPWLDDHIAGVMGTEIIDRIDVESIPTLDSMAAAISWWNKKLIS